MLASLLRGFQRVFMTWFILNHSATGAKTDTEAGRDTKRKSRRCQMGFLSVQVGHMWTFTTRCCQGNNKQCLDIVKSKCHCGKQLFKRNICSPSLVGLIVRFLSPRSVCLHTTCPSLCPTSKNYPNQYRSHPEVLITYLTHKLVLST